MVSLGEDSRRSGGFFFDRNESYHGDSEELLTDDGLSGHGDGTFKRLPTPWVIGTLIICIICQVLSAFLIPTQTSLTCQSDGTETSASAIIAYTQVLLWFLCLLFDRYCQYQHYLSRMAGYLEFYRHTRNIRRLPLVVVSGATAVMLLILAVLNDYCPNNGCGDSLLSCCNYQQILVSAQMVVLLVVLTKYMVHTCKFNRRKAPPDVCQEDFVVSLFQPQPMATDVGYRDESYIDEVLEKQADMIRYLKQHNVNLARRVVNLNSQLRQHKDLNS